MDELLTLLAALQDANTQFAAFVTSLQETRRLQLELQEALAKYEAARENLTALADIEDWLNSSPEA